MSYLAWMAVCGALLLTMALASAYLKRLPVSTSIIYLAVGVALGPLGLAVVRVDLREEHAWLERVTELAVIVSLFVNGAKLRLPIGAPEWRAPLRLASLLMVGTIAAVAVFCRFAFGMPWPAACLLGAVLAPTDPVLASALTVDSASDHDRMRYGLTGEAGLNDGTAFPFVVLALLWSQQGSPSEWIGQWAAHRLIWAVMAALLGGYALGNALGRLAIHVRSRERDTAAPNDFLALAVIALAYVTAEAMGAWGFLSVFAAGLGLRGAELKVVHASEPLPGRTPTETSVSPSASDASASMDVGVPAEQAVAAKVGPEELAHPRVAAGTLLAEVLSFGATVERLLEVMLVLGVGMALAQHFDWRALLLGFVLMVVLRPLLTQVALLGTPTTRMQRWLMGWFGIRGIGSLYYLLYALREGLAADVARDVTNLTVSVVALSVVVHGASAQPLMDRYEASLNRGA